MSDNFAFSGLFDAVIFVTSFSCVEIAWPLTQSID
jgi:hypothetical protein